MTQNNRHAVISVEEIISYVMKYRNSSGRSPSRVALSTGHTVNISSLKLLTFALNAMGTVIECVDCGLKATHCAVENGENKDGVTYHVNLYGIRDDKEIMFTHDHIIARSLGGKDRLSNTQIMCQRCNSTKSKFEQIFIEKRKLDKMINCAESLSGRKLSDYEI